MPILKKDISICYETFGDKNNPCVIFIMGLTGQLVNWPDELIQGLVEKGFYVITFDNRDVGLSSYYDHLETPELAEIFERKKAGEAMAPPYTLEDMAEDVLVLMDGLAISRAHLVGISMGGQIAQYFSMSHADRLLSLTLIGTSSGDPGLAPAKPAVLQHFLRSRPQNSDLQTSIKHHVEQYKLYHHPDDFDLEATTAMHTKAYQRAYHPMGNRRQLIAMIAAAPRGEALRSVQVPALVIHGDYDPVMPVENGKQLAACFPKCELLVIENMGHGLPARACPIMVDAMTSHFKKTLGE